MKEYVSKQWLSQSGTDFDYIATSISKTYTRGYTQLKDDKNGLEVIKLEISDGNDKVFFCADTKNGKIDLVEFENFLKKIDSLAYEINKFGIALLNYKKNRIEFEASNPECNSN